jgi:NADPH-dependent curcumin reductase CurA
MGRMGEFYAEMAPWIASGKVSSRETIHEGIEAMPDAFLGLFTGGNTGKMLVRL